MSQCKVLGLKAFTVILVPTSWVILLEGAHAGVSCSSQTFANLGFQVSQCMGGSPSSWEPSGRSCPSQTSRCRPPSSPALHHIRNEASSSEAGAPVTAARLSSSQFASPSSSYDWLVLVTEQHWGPPMQRPYHLSFQGTYFGGCSHCFGFLNDIAVLQDLLIDNSSGPSTPPKSRETPPLHEGPHNQLTTAHHQYLCNLFHAVKASNSEILA